MMDARPSIAAVRTEASKSLSKQQIRDLEASKAGKAPVKASGGGFFEFFGIDTSGEPDEEVSGEPVYEPRDPNQLTKRELSEFDSADGEKILSLKKAREQQMAKKRGLDLDEDRGIGKVEKPVAAPAVKEVAAPAMAMAKKEENKEVKAEAPAGGGFFGFLNKEPEAPKPIKAAPAPVEEKEIAPVAMAAKKTVVKEEAPSGGLFGFFNKEPEVSKVKTEVKKEAPAAPAMAAKKVVKAAPVEEEEDEAPSGGFFGFLAPSPSPAKVVCIYIHICMYICIYVNVNSMTSPVIIDLGYLKVQ
jgi:hypothetical protein